MLHFRSYRAFLLVEESCGGKQEDHSIRLDKHLFVCADQLRWA